MKVLFIKVSVGLKTCNSIPCFAILLQQHFKSLCLNFPSLITCLLHKNSLELDFYYFLVLETGTLISLGSLYCCNVNNIQFNGVPLMIILKYPTSYSSH